MVREENALKALVNEFMNIEKLNGLFSLSANVSSLIGPSLKMLSAGGAGGAAGGLSAL